MQARKTTKHLTAGAVTLALLLGTVPPILWAQQEKPIRAVTPQQKEHSRLYNSRSGKDPKIINAKLDQDIVIVEIAEFLHSSGPEKTPVQALLEAACGADAVLIGTVQDSLSLLSEDETHIFTEYTVHIEEILKDNPASRLVPADSITVTGRGGTVVINAHKLSTASNASFTFLKLRRYLFYLKFIPTTGAYRSNGTESFELRSNRYIPQSELPLWNQNLHRIEESPRFLDIVRSTITGPCAETDT